MLYTGPLDESDVISSWWVTMNYLYAEYELPVEKYGTKYGKYFEDSLRRKKFFDSKFLNSSEFRSLPGQNKKK